MGEELEVPAGFSAAEREAMRERAAELRGARGGGKRVEAMQAALDAIAAMPDEDRLLAERVHALVTRVAPDLLPRTWYGMPAWSAGKDVVCFFQGAAKFDSRYCTLGFNDRAALDDGAMWPTAFALVAWSDEVEATVEGLVRRAIA